MKRITSFDSIILALGGVSAVARLTRRSPATVCNWRPRSLFPPRLYFVMQHELERRGYEAPRKLWGFQEIIAAEAA